MTALHRYVPQIVVSIVITTLGITVFGQAPSSVKTVKISPEIAEAEIGQQVKFSATGYDAEGKPVESKTVIWAALPPDLAVADRSGTVTFYGPGEIRVIALVAGKPAIARIVVKPAKIKQIEVRVRETPLLVGGTTKLSAKAIGINGDPRQDVELEWSSANPSVAVVDAAGLVTGVAPGETKITVKAEGGSGEISISVVKTSIRSLTIEPRTTKARTGDVIRFRPHIMAADGKEFKDAAVRWSVEGEGASIQEGGIFVAERPGSYVVTGSVGNYSAAATVVVAPRSVERSLELVGRIKLKDIQVAEQWFFGNYIYVSTIWDQVQVYDISDPQNPKLTDTVKVDARVVNDISLTADGKIGVMTREGASNRKNGIVFLDTSDPAHPKIISEYTETVTGGVHSAYIDSHYVYLTDDATGSMRVIDFKEVKNPKEVARWEVEMRGPKPANDGTGEQLPPGRVLHDVQVKEGLAYLAYWRDGLVILDVGNGIKGGTPENPKFVSQLRFNHHELYGSGWIAGTHEVYRYKNYVFVGDEVFPEMFALYDRSRIPARGVLHVVDVSDILNPRKVAEYAVPEGGAHNVWVKDDVLVMGYYGAGGRVLDVSGELSGDLYREGREIARLWTGDPEGYRPNLPFTWGARQYRDYIFFCDINSGIWIIKLGQPAQKGLTTAPGQ